MTQPEKIHGVDISHHQEQRIDYTALKRAGVQWMYHKATEGVSFTDENYGHRRIEASRAKLPFGAYHFARPGPADARSEASFFIRIAKPVIGDLRPCLDLETHGSLTIKSLIKWADDFCDEVEKQTGVIPVVYTPFTLSRELEEKAIFWVPRYNNSNNPPTRSWDIWQFSNGQFGVPNFVPGLGRVDLNTSKIPTSDLIISEDNKTRGKHVDTALEALDKSKAKGEKRDLISRAKRILKKITPR